MSTTYNSGFRAVGLPATAKIIGAAWATQSAKFHAVKAERQKANHLDRCGNIPKERVQFLIKAESNRNDEGEAPQ
jgi:hypothetical protein